MSGALTHSAFSRIGQLASLPRVHAAFQWFHLHDRRMMQWQQELVSIAAPPFGESRRAEWLAERFRELGLEQVEIDSVGNVLGCYPGKRPRAGQRCVMLSAHIDTVFPLHTPIAPWRERIGANVVLDGAGSEVVVTQALGSRRFLVTMKGPGGHSWTDAGVPNPVVVLSRAITAMSEVALPASPRTTLNIGTMEGGSSVNSI